MLMVRVTNVLGSFIGELIILHQTFTFQEKLTETGWRGGGLIILVRLSHS